MEAIWVFMSQRSGILGWEEPLCGWDSAGKSRGRCLERQWKTQRDTWEERQGCSHENIFPGDYRTSHPTSALLKVKVKERLESFGSGVSWVAVLMY